MENTHFLLNVRNSCIPFVNRSLKEFVKIPNQTEHKLHIRIQEYNELLSMQRKQYYVKLKYIYMRRNIQKYDIYIKKV